MKKMLIAALAAILVILGGSGAWAAATIDDAKALVIKAADVLAADGKVKAYATFQDKNGPFWVNGGELYVFVINLKGAWEAYPPKPEAVGTSLFDLKDVDGKLFVQEMITLAQTKGEGMSQYKWKNPATNKIQDKVSYLKKVGDVIVAAGVYK